MIHKEEEAWVSTTEFNGFLIFLYVTVVKQSYQCLFGMCVYFFLVQKYFRKTMVKRVYAKSALRWVGTTTSFYEWGCQNTSKYSRWKVENSSVVGGPGKLRFPCRNVIKTWPCATPKIRLHNQCNYHVFLHLEAKKKREWGRKRLPFIDFNSAT